MPKEKVTPNGVTVHKGGYSSLSDAYGALIAWIQEPGYNAMVHRMIFMSKQDLTSLPMEEWETEVYFPVKKK